MYCRNCGKQITSIAEECPYCKTKVNENNENNEVNNNEIKEEKQNQQEQNKNWDVLYNDMNGNPVTIWRFIIGILLIVVGIAMLI